MSPENAIEVRNLKKKFKVYYDKGNSLKEKVLFRSRNRYEERWVLKGISFDVKKGEAIGLIGHNGCGKSTTLKLLNKIIYPTSGTIEMKGRISSLIELGAGFHPDMSGRENIYINASIFGLTRKEIDARIDDIIAFSELEEYMDNPVRTYSSGMYMRLAFAVAINVDADILLIDEILAVGDANFQAKCFNKLREIKGKGVTIVIVSHSLGQIEQICERSIWIDQGEIREEGKPRDVHPVYMDYMGQKREFVVENEKNPKIENVDSGKVIDVEHVKSDIVEEQKELGNFDVKILKVELLNERGKPTSVFSVDEKVEMCIYYEKKREDLDECVFGFHIFRNDGVDCYGSNTLIDKIGNVKLKKQGMISVIFEAMSLLQGKYKIDVAFHDEFGVTYHHIYDAVTFELISKYADVGVVRLMHTWIVDGNECERI